MCVCVCVRIKCVAEQLTRYQEYVSSTAVLEQLNSSKDDVTSTAVLEELVRLADLGMPPPYLFLQR